tara:strand:- start:2532 stop:3518 length:987 start_codon:yes stop_codon:yes gene_type:complete
MTKKILHTFWDFNINPISFDIIWFLCAADHYSNQNGYDSFMVHFIPEKNEEQREYPKEFDEVVDIESRRFRKRNICYQSLFLFRRCKDFIVYSDYQKAINEKKKLTNVFPKSNVFYLNEKGETGHWEYFNYVNKNIDFEKNLNCGVNPAEQGNRYIKKWFSYKKINPEKAVSLTLRQLSFDKDRNNNLELWLNFADYLLDNSFIPIIVLDSDRIYEKYDFEQKFICNRDVAFNVELRASLYHNCSQNYFVSSGPASLAQLNPTCKYVTTNVINKVTDEKNLEFLNNLNGFDIPNQPKFCNTQQYFYWEKENLEILKSYFEKFKEKNKS